MARCVASLVMDPNELHSRLVDAGIQDLVEVLLPPKTYERINTMLNSVLTSPAPAWLMSLYAAQDGLTAGYYHCRNVEQVERAVDVVARRIYADTPLDMPTTTLSFGARRLTYEYQAFIFALGRSFDYLAGGLTCGLGCDFVSNFKKVPGPLKHARPEHRAAADAITQGCLTAIEAFPEVFDPQKGRSIRDQIAHRRSVPGGQFSVSFRPGQPVAVELEGGAEQLPLIGDSANGPGRLSATLLDRLISFEDKFMELTALIPAVEEARTMS